MTPQQVAQVAYQAGFRGNGLVTMVAIAGAESGWSKSAVGDVSLESAKWGPSVGLWQIRTLKSQYGTGKTRDEKKLKNAYANAKAAYAISNGGKNFHPWTTYTNGAYQHYMSQAKKAAQSVHQPTTTLTNQKSNPYIPSATGDLVIVFGLTYMGYLGYRMWRRRG